MKQIKKILATLLAVCMVCSTVLTSALAAEIVPETGTAAEETLDETTVAEETLDETTSEAFEEDETDVVPSDSSAAEPEEAVADAGSTFSVQASNDTDEKTDMYSISKTQNVSLEEGKTYKIFHLDCGRKYFTVEQIEAIIDTMAENDYEYLELAIGNDGLRFLLDDMSVTVNDTTYASDKVIAGIQAGNDVYDATKKYTPGSTEELTEDEMNSIIAYAAGKGISIIPLINSPGHMDAILTAMSKLGISNANYSTSTTTVDVTNTEAVNFTLALINKYIQYFADKGCELFNLGADEYANDTGNPQFGNMTTDQYTAFATYVNSMAAQIQNAGMVAMAFNDGINYQGKTTNVPFDTNIAVAYWSSGWSSYTVASAASLATSGFKIINTNGDWYYVIGRTGEESASIDKAVTYINSTPYNSVMGSGTMDVAGCMVCTWSDDPAATYDAEAVTTQLTTFAKANTEIFTLSDNGDVSTGDSDADTDIKVIHNVTVDVALGQSTQKTITEDDYSNNIDETDLDKSIATVKVSGSTTEGTPGTPESTDKVTTSSITDGTYIIGNGNQWLVLNANGTLGSTTEASQATKWTVTVSNNTYYIKSGNHYLRNRTERNTFSLNTDTSNKYASWRYGGDNGFYFSDYYLQYSNGWTLSKNSSNETDGFAYTYTPEVPAVPGTATTIVTFTGESLGTTHVTVGNTYYTINVIEEDLSKVSPLTIEYWITNGRSVDSNNSNSISVSAADAYTEEGVEVSSIVPANTTKETRTLQYWRTRLLDTTKTNSSTSGTEEQTETAGDDETYNGVGFTRVRYYNSVWAVYTENNEWVEVKDQHQLVAYYLEILPVADELVVTAADWGKKGDGSTSGDYLEPASSCTVSVQVVYEDGTTNPAGTTAELLNSRTIAYGYWSQGRGVGTLNLTGLEGYQIWKVEAETGSETYSGESTTWGSYTVDNFTWDDNAMTVYEGEPVDSYVIHNDAHSPSADGYYQNLMWDENHEAILITVYVKAKPTDQNLKVIYYDEKFNDELYSYSINVDANTDFGDITPTPDVFSGNSDRIDVTGKGIKNTLGVIQYFQTDLTKVPEAVGKYDSKLYSYTGSTISEDRKTLYLYYNINTEVLSPMFVADFGLPIEFNLSQVVKNPGLVKEVTVNANTRYGTLEYNNGTQTFTYTPTSVLKNIDVLTINIKFDSSDSYSTTNAGVMPATTVYYEEGFASMDGFSGGSKGSGRQVAQIAGESTNEYGYDAKYSKESYGASNGTEATSTAKGDKATFSFTGTGIDIYANTSPDTGKLFVSVKNSEGKTVKNISVDTSMRVGETSATSGQNVTAYNIPVVTLDLGSRDTYTVSISNVIVDTATGVKSVNLDGFRVYGTIAEDNDYYVQDKEDNPDYIELRNETLAAYNVNKSGACEQIYGGDNATVSITTNNAYSVDGVQDMLDNGPKNELYLYKGQSITFSVNTKRQVQLGMKALTGSVDVTGSYSGTIISSTDMFYTVGSGELADNETVRTVTITNNSQNNTDILSITKIKICDDPNAALVAMTAEDVAEAIRKPEPTTADATLNISVADYTGTELASTVLTATGTEGEENVFAAADIAEAAKSVLPEGYALADETAVADQTVVYGEDGTVTVQAGKVATLNVTYKKLFGKTVGTVVLTKVQTSDSTKATFSTSEIRAAVPEGYTAMSLIGTSVKYGSESSKTVYVY